MSRSPIIMGLWPIAGITTVGVTAEHAEQTMAAAIEAGITQFDTAFSYGYDGQSDRLLGRFIAPDRDRFRVIAKVGQRWTANHQRVIDGSKQTLIADAETSLKRMGAERFDLLMLHSPDPNVAIERSAEAIEELKRRGLCDRIGVCNATTLQRQRFASAASCDAIQCPLNLFQPDALHEVIPSANADACDVLVYWSLMKGLLAGKITRDQVFSDDDVRPSYPIFQGERRERAHQVVDSLAKLGKSIERTVAQLAIGWALSQRGVSGVLVGARYPTQIRETALSTRLSSETLATIDALLAE